jgi:type III pantothenate kinase
VPGRQARVLLIGNSRWHWAETPIGSDGPFPLQPGADWAFADGPPPRPGAWQAGDTLAWAAVGPVPADQVDHLPAQRRLVTAQVPLAATPPWLGVDRALVGWRAWRRQQAIEPSPVLVADAGTVLSLTLVGRDGRFLGGRLLAGAALQWRAMAAGTAHLPTLDLPTADRPWGHGRLSEPMEAWPQATAAAMEVGVLQGLAAAVAQAHGQLPGALEAGHGPRLWLCGGDSPRLAPLLRASGVDLQEAPHLAIEALIALAPFSPGPGR